MPTSRAQGEPAIRLGVLDVPRCAWAKQQLGRTTRNAEPNCLNIFQKQMQDKLESPQPPSDCPTQLVFSTQGTKAAMSQRDPAHNHQSDLVLGPRGRQHYNLHVCRNLNLHQVLQKDHSLMTQMVQRKSAVYLQSALKTKEMGELGELLRQE